MKKYLAAAAAVSLLVVAAPAAAQTYGALGYSEVGTDAGDVSAVTGKLGWRGGSWFGVEGEASVGLDDDEGVELNHQLGLYATATAPINETFEVFGRVGWAMADVDFAGIEDSDDGLALGVGASAFFDGVNGVRFEYTNIDFEDFDEKADIWSLSYVRRFQ